MRQVARGAMKISSLLAVGLTLLLAAACGDGGSSGTAGTAGTGTAGTGGTGGGTGGTTGSMPPDASCVKAGEKGNDIGVGTFCTPGGNECSQFPEAGFCLADIGEDQWFCTRVGCKADADCGMDATCHMDPAGSGCVPNKCESGGSGGSGGTTGSGGSGG